MAEDKTEVEKAALKKLQDLIAGMQAGGDNWLLQMLQLFLGMFTGYDPDQKGHDGARTPEEEQTAARDYEGRRASEEQTYGKYTTPERFIPQSIEDLSKLKALRDKYGEGVQAIVPVRGDVRIASDFGDRIHPITHKHSHHDGLDITPTKSGTKLPIIAPMPGQIMEIRYRGGYGLTMDMMDIYGVRHRFAHLSGVSDEIAEKMKNKQPAMVEPGDDIATMGRSGKTTGVHLHYEQMGKGNSKRAPEIAGKTWHEGEKFTDSGHGAHGQERTERVVAHPKPANLKASTAKAAFAAVSFKPPVPEKPSAKPTYGNGKFEVSDVAEVAENTLKSALTFTSDIKIKIGGFFHL